MTEPIIHAENVHKSFRNGNVEVHVLRGIDIAVEKGEMVAIMGPSGCGKTTMLNCLSGLDEFDSGEVLIEGKPICRRWADKERTSYRAESMGFVFQTFNLLPVISAVENVELPLTGQRRQTQRSLGKRALKALDQVWLSDRAHHRPAQLSAGQRQRVTIARALINSPAIVWADEPTGNLDSESAEDVLELLRSLNAQYEQTIIIVTHNREIGELCDRIVWMRDGQIVARSDRCDQG